MFLINVMCFCSKWNDLFVTAVAPTTQKPATTTTTTAQPSKLLVFQSNFNNENKLVFRYSWNNFLFIATTTIKTTQAPSTTTTPISKLNICMLSYQIILNGIHVSKIYVGFISQSFLRKQVKLQHLHAISKPWISVSIKFKTTSSSHLRTILLFLVNLIWPLNKTAKLYWSCIKMGSL